MFPNFFPKFLLIFPKFRENVFKSGIQPYFCHVNTVLGSKTPPPPRNSTINTVNAQIVYHRYHIDYLLRCIKNFCDRLTCNTSSNYTGQHFGKNKKFKLQPRQDHSVSEVINIKNKIKKSLAQEVRQKSDISEHTSKG